MASIWPAPGHPRTGGGASFNSLDFLATLIYDAPTLDGRGKGKRTAGMSGQTLSRQNFSQVVLLWTWLVVTFSLALGSGFPSASSNLSRQGDTLTTPTTSLELVGTPTPKSKSVQPLIESLPALPASGVFITDSRSAFPCCLWNDAPSLSPPAAWQSPSLPRPPPHA